VILFTSSAVQFQRTAGSGQYNLTCGQHLVAQSELAAFGSQKESWQQLAAKAREQHLAAQSQSADCNGRPSITLSAAVKQLIDW